MAQIRKIVPSGQISDFRQAAPDAGGGFKLLAGAMDAAYQHFLPIAISEEQQKADAEWRIYAKSQMGAGSVHASSKGYAPGAAPPDGEGWLRYSNTGKIRDKPISAELQTAMSFLPEMGVTMEVFSGGQDAAGEGGKRTGSTRHDHGGAADVFFYKDGRRLDWNNPDDIPVFKEIVQRGKAAGITGWGAGDGYMQPGSMHIGFGSEAVWGADGKGENAAPWLREAVGGAPTITASSKTEPVMIRNKEGGLEPRLYAPSSDPIKQAYNAAAGVAYLSEAQLGSMTAFMQMSEEFKLDPDGFRQAAESYVDQMVENAPDLLKADLRGTLGEEMVRRFNGMWAEKHQETSQRAANANGALIERVSDDLASAIAGGDAKEIAVQRERLTGLLTARESLPDLAWTAEQSFNQVLDAEEKGRKLIAERAKEVAKKDGSDMDVAIAASRAGMTAAAEARFLSDPAYAALYPDRVAELRAWANFRDLGPTFDSLSLEEQDSLVAAAFSAEPESKYEVEIAKALASRALANREARSAEIRVENTTAMLRDSSTEWNPYDSTQKKDVSEAYDSLRGENDPLSPEGQRIAAEIAARTGFVPDSMVDAVRTALHAGDPAALAVAMEFVGQASRDFPSIFGAGDVGKEVMGALSDYRFFSRYMSAEEASAMMVAADLPENVERRERMAPLVKEKIKGLTPDDIKGHFDQRGVDVVVPEGEAGAEVMSEYSELFEAAFVATGNADLAKQRALDSLSRVYGPSGIDGSETLMRYPPTSFYPARDGTHDWMRDQLERDVTEFATGADLPDDEDTRNWFGSVKSGIIGSDRIRMVSDAGTQDDIAAGRAPSYTVQFLDEDEVWQLVPGRFRFDVPSQFSVDKESFDRERKVQTERSNIEAWKEYMIQDPNRTKTIPDIDALLSADRDFYISKPPPEGY